AFMPALAAYAAAAADVLPVEAQITDLLPASFAFATATTIPRSLKEPVGFNPSYFPYRLIPSSLEICGKCKSGVFPSYKEISGVSSVTGKNALYAFIIPCHVIV